MQNRLKTRIVLHARGYSDSTAGLCENFITMLKIILYIITLCILNFILSSFFHFYMYYTLYYNIQSKVYSNIQITALLIRIRARKN